MRILEQESSKQQEEVVNTNEIVDEKQEESSHIVEHTESKEVVLDTLLTTGKL